MEDPGAGLEGASGGAGSGVRAPALEERFDSMHPRGLLQLDFHLSFKSDIN